MKHSLIAILSLIALSASAQFDASKHTATNKPIAVNGNKPLDAKSQKLIDSTFGYRDYASVAEANAEVPANQRAGHPTVFIRNNGVVDEYWWRNGTANSDLVLKQANVNVDSVLFVTKSRLVDSLKNRPKFSLTPSSEALGSNHIAVFGNSLGLGIGGAQVLHYPAGIPWAYYLTQLSGYDVQSFSVGGENSTQIKNRFLADTAKWKWPLIFDQLGANNSGSPSVVLADIDQIVHILDSVGNTQYLFTNIVGQSSPTYWQGTSTYDGLMSLNSQSRTHVGVAHYLDIRTPFVASYNPAIAQDSIDHSHDIPPTSLFYPGDFIHYNDDGYSVVASVVYLNMDILKPASSSKVFTLSSGLDMFKSAPPIKTRQIISGQQAINAPALPTNILTDAANQTDLISLLVRGNVRLMNSRAPSGKEGGIEFYNKYSDQGGRSNMGIRGTNPLIWNNTNGLTIREDINSFEFGSPLRIMNAGINADGQVKADNGIFMGGGIHVSSITNSGEFISARRVLDLASTLGIIIPRIAMASAPGLFDARDGELFWDITSSRLAVSRPGPYANSWEFQTVPYYDDPRFLPAGGFVGQIPKRVPGGVEWGDLNTSTKLVGTVFSSAVLNGDPTFSAANAFDGSTSINNQWASIANPAFIGLAFTVKHILTKVRAYPVPGNLFPTVLQGSNTSPTTGFTDIYTLPSAPAADTWTDYNLPLSSTGYLYYRLYTANPSGAYVQALEIEYYGYPLPAIPEVFLAQPNSFTKTNTFSDSVLLKNVPVLAGPKDSALWLDRSTGMIKMVSVKTADTVLVRMFAIADSSAIVFVNNYGIKDTLEFVGGGGPATWGQILGNVANQTDLIALLSGYALASHTHTFASLTSKPTTIAGYGITDAFIQAQADALYASLSHTHSAGDVTSGTFASARYGSATIPVTAINATGGTSTDFLRKDGTWAMPAGGAGGGKDITLRNAYQGDSAIWHKTDSTLVWRGELWNFGAGFSLSTEGSNDSLKVKTVNLTGAPPANEFVWETSSTTYAPSPSNGGTQNLIYTGTATGNWVMPTGATSAGMIFWISNTSTFTLNLNVTLYESSVTTSTAIPAGKKIKAVVISASPYKYYLMSIN